MHQAPITGSPSNDKTIEMHWSEKNSWTKPSQTSEVVGGGPGQTLPNAARVPAQNDLTDDSRALSIGQGCVIDTNKVDSTQIGFSVVSDASVLLSSLFT